MAKAFMRDPLRLRDFLLSRLANQNPIKTWSGSDAFISPDARTILIRVRGKRPPSDLDFCSAFTRQITAAATHANQDGLKLQFTGSYAIAAQSAHSIRSDMIASVIGSVLCLQVLFLLAYRSALRLFWLALAPIALLNAPVAVLLAPFALLARPVAVAESPVANELAPYAVALAPIARAVSPTAVAFPDGGPIMPPPATKSLATAALTPAATAATSPPAIPKARNAGPTQAPAHTCRRDLNPPTSSEFVLPASATLPTRLFIKVSGSLDSPRWRRSSSDF
jgi:hypothetical protein